MGKAVAAAAEVVEPSHADVLIDFSHRDAVLKHIELAISLGKNLVIGTTGWDDRLADAQSLVEKSQIGVIYGPNFSVGVHVMRQLVSQAKSCLPAYDVAGVEYHHKEKVDAPSGTALKMDVPFASVRVGTIPGIHTVLFDSPQDTIEITHRAKGREAFAKGALDAAKWIQGKRGFFHFDHFMKDVWKH